MQFRKKVICKNYENNKDKVLCKVFIGDIANVILNWSHNRPEDNFRVNEIMNKIRVNKTIIGEIRIWKNKNTYYIYDGLHRYKACEKLYNNELINFEINIIIYDTIDENNIIEEFIDINKSIPIPSLYTDNSINNGFIQDSIRRLQEKYPDFVKTTRNPMRPNFNRDLVVDVIHNIIKNRNDISKVDLDNILIDLNNNMRENIDTLKINDKIYRKCKSKNLYLFMYGIEIFKQKLEEEINKQNNTDLLIFV